jgi:hypothetical protein
MDMQMIELAMDSPHEAVRYEPLDWLRRRQLCDEGGVGCRIQEGEE